MTKSLVYVFGGEGKGKTSAALGIVMRAVGSGMRVGWVAWYKQESWGLSELPILKRLGVEVFMLGRGFYLKETQNSELKTQNSNFRTQTLELKTQKSKLNSQNAKVKGRARDLKLKTAPVGKMGQRVVDLASIEEHVGAAKAALEKARELVSGGEYDLVVMDEVNNAVTDKLIELSDLLELIEQRRKTHLVLTGREVSAAVAAEADLVTECKKIKHPYDEGRLAVRGLDY